MKYKLPDTDESIIEEAVG